LYGTVAPAHSPTKEGKKKATRNDRIVAVEQDNHSFAAITHIDDLGKAFVREFLTVPVWIDFGAAAIDFSGAGQSFGDVRRDFCAAVLGSRRDTTSREPDITLNELAPCMKRLGSCTR